MAKNAFRPEAVEELIAVCTTTDTEASAQTLARALVERRLAACVQISAIDSVYRWKGEVQTAAEYRLRVKTTVSRGDAVRALLLALHPYELPAIWSERMESVLPGYADWVRANSTG